MTKSEILKMTGTQEEVDLVATLMGWHKVRMPWGVLVWQDKERKNLATCEHWNPFESWGDVETVVEELNNRGLLVEIKSDIGYGSCTLYDKANSSLHDTDVLDEEMFVEADNVPTAICRAALLTLEE